MDHLDQWVKRVIKVVTALTDYKEDLAHQVKLDPKEETAKKDFKALLACQE